MRGFLILSAALLVAGAVTAGATAGATVGATMNVYTDNGPDEGLDEKPNEKSDEGLGKGLDEKPGEKSDGGSGEGTERLDSVVVSTSRAGGRTPVAFTMVGEGRLRKANPSHSLPMNLNLQPSVVTYSEGGTGLGNSTMTVRGSKGSQINVTLNGITLNDSESQEVFWVNIPSLTSLISSVQLQRGLGTSANGAGAFGASVNMNTSSVSAEPFAAADFSLGSWNTSITSAAAGTGLTSRGLYFNIAYSRGNTDGYIRNAHVASQSAFAVLGWIDGKNSLRLTWLMGKQRSGITWDGISLEQYETDRRYNGAGEYSDEFGNVYYYDNQTDNYVQNHFQLNYTRQFSERWTWSNTFNYTRGDGYDEYYKEDRSLKDFGLEPTAQTSDMIYQKKMGNNYYVLNSDLRYRTDKLSMTWGVYLSRYEGDHFGQMLWVKTLGQDYDYDSYNERDGFYRNRSLKHEATAFVRGEWTPMRWMTLYADLQYRGITLDMEGGDDDVHETGLRMAYGNRWNFFNPRAGVSFTPAQGHKAYASAALGHREPGRSDIKENIKGDMSPIRPERMVDIELGYEYKSDRLSASANIYLMEYRDMLLETGRLSSSGYAVKENVPRGWRRGIELAGSWTAAPWFSLGGNITLSTNKIHEYTSYVEVWDGEPGQTKAFNYGKTRMMMSPSVVGMFRAAVSPWRNTASNSLRTTTLAVDGKYVGMQFLDNTQRAEMAVPAYFVSNLSLSHEFRLNRGTLGLAGYVDNLLNSLYYAAGWRWEGYTQADDALTYGVGVYPQPPASFMLKVSYRF